MSKREFGATLTLLLLFVCAVAGVIWMGMTTSEEAYQYDGFRPHREGDEIVVIGQSQLFEDEETGGWVLFVDSLLEPAEMKELEWHLSFGDVKDVYFKKNVDFKGQDETINRWLNVYCGR